ncbi:hypothetical protein D3C81_1372760 [compost metagenome]
MAVERGGGGGVERECRLAQPVDKTLLQQQDGLHVVEAGLPHEVESAGDFGGNLVQRVAACEPVGHQMAADEAGRGHVAVGDAGRKARPGAVGRVAQRLRPHAELVERQQRAGFIGGVAMPRDQFPRHRAVAEAVLVGRVAMADQHTEPAQRGGGGAADAMRERQPDHLAQFQEGQVLVDETGGHG